MKTCRENNGHPDFFFQIRPVNLKQHCMTSSVCFILLILIIFQVSCSPLKAIYGYEDNHILQSGYYFMVARKNGPGQPSFGRIKYLDGAHFGTIRENALRYIDEYGNFELIGPFSSESDAETSLQEMMKYQIWVRKADPTRVFD